MMKETDKELIELTFARSRRDKIVDTPLGELKIARSDGTGGETYSIYEPCLCFIVQGEKIATIGNALYPYGPDHYLVTSVNLPVKGQVTKASPESPYLCLILSIDPKVVFDVSNAVAPFQGLVHTPSPGAFTDKTSQELSMAFLRLLRSLDDDEDRDFLGPLLVKEIVYFLLKSEYSLVLRQIGIFGSETQRIAKAVHAIRQDFSLPLEPKKLARSINMSLPAFYKNFKQVTNLTPLQYQKQIRLQEARRLLSTEIHEAASVGYLVGYESPSQFSRDYSRLFGLPPIKDIDRLKKESHL